MRRLVLLPLAALAACSTLSSLQAVSATADAVVFEYTGDRAAEAARQASLYCANLGRSARLRDVAQGERDIATFDCR